MVEVIFFIFQIKFAQTQMVTRYYSLIQKMHLWQSRIFNIQPDGKNTYLLKIKNSKKIFGKLTIYGNLSLLKIVFLHHTFIPIVRSFVSTDSQGWVSQLRYDWRFLDRDRLIDGPTGYANFFLRFLLRFPVRSLLLCRWIGSVQWRRNTTSTRIEPSRATDENRPLLSFCARSSQIVTIPRPVTQKSWIAGAFHVTSAPLQFYRRRNSICETSRSKWIYSRSS